jgi:hypothetical protein
MPMPAFAPMVRSLCRGESSEVELGVDAVVLELTTDAGDICSEVDPETDAAVLELVTDADVAEEVGSIDVLVAVQPSKGIEKMVCRSAGDGALNCSSLGSLQDGSLFESAPQHCQSPDELFQIASGSCWDVHLFAKPGHVPETSVQLPM